MNHLLKLLDLSTEEITGILDLADQLKYERKHNIPHELLKGQTLGMIFQKSSTRTRVSFETGMYQLGGHALFLSSRDLQIGRGEPVQDTARVLSRYLDGIMIRTFEQKEVEDLAKFGSIPVINGLTDFCHPCQVLADLMTIREKFGSFSGLKMCFIGDGNNMANSLIVGGLKVGMNVAVATPDGYKPDGAVLDFTKGYGDKFALETDPFMAASGVDSRTILDMNGAEKLLGNGDMLFYPSGYPKPLRVQGAFVSDGEVSNVTEFLKEQNEDTGYNTEIEKKLTQSSLAGGAGGQNERDALFTDAGKFIIEKDKASIGMLQRMFKIGFNRAARIMDQLAEAGVVGEEEGTKPRKILMSMEEFEEFLEAGY